MRKVILFIVLLFASIPSIAFAQNDNSADVYRGVKASPGKYIVFARIIKNLNASNLYFDYGQDNSEGKRDNRGQVLADENGKAIPIAYTMAVINKLVRLGWNVYGGIGGDEIYFYKEISDDSEITEGLHFKK